MTRRSFFAALTGFAASLGLPWRAEGKTPVQAMRDYLGSARYKYAEALARREVLRKRYPYPVIYDGDLLDPRYKLAGMMPHARLRSGKLFVNGVDRTREAYESYEGDDGWANLFLCTPEGQTVRIGGDVLRYSVRGKVEWREDCRAEDDRMLAELAQGSGVTVHS